MLHIIRKLKNIYHLVEAFIANIFYGFPARKLKIIGVTGTDGKTTTTHLIYHILKSAGKKVSMISTVYAKIGEKVFETGLHTTTPGSFSVQKLLKLSTDHKDAFFVLETTSHALDQNRVWGIKFHIALVTNITHEHLDYHINYGNYLLAKAKLLNNSQIALINRDDQSFSALQHFLKSHQKKYYTYGLNKKSDFTYNFIKSGFNLTEFNYYNYLAAFSVCKLLKIDTNAIIKEMKCFQLPKGRLNIIYDKDFMVIIDFANTPNAIDVVLKSIKDKYLKGNGRLIHVFGSAGLRDKSKRSLMGEASGQHSDIVILTEEDYRTENPLKICEQISLGLIKNDFKSNKLNLIEQKDKKIYSIIINRVDAIKKAISIAKKNDIVIITGKGHEKSLCRGRIEYPWDEDKTIMDALKTKQKL